MIGCAGFILNLSHVVCVLCSVQAQLKILPSESNPDDNFSILFIYFALIVLKLKAERML